MRSREIYGDDSFKPIQIKAQFTIAETKYFCGNYVRNYIQITDNKLLQLFLQKRT